MASQKSPVLGATPRADLLPDAQRAEIRHEETLPKLLLVLIGCGVVAALIWAAGLIPVTFAQQTRAALEARSAQLNAEIASFDETALLLQSVGSREVDREKLTAEEVLFMELRDEIQAKLPSGTSFASFSAALVLPEEETAEPDEDCVATGAVAMIHLATSELNALNLAASFIDGMGDIGGFLCGQVVDATAVSSAGAGEEGAPAQTTVVQIRATFDETVRAGRFVEDAL